MEDTTSGDGMVGSGVVPSEEETFHIYVLSFAYGILVVSFVGRFFQGSFGSAWFWLY